MDLEKKTNTDLSDLADFNNNSNINSQTTQETGML